MGKRVPRTRAGGKWTEARYWSFIRSALRRASVSYPVKHELKMRVRREVKGKQHKFEYPCNTCGKWFPDKNIDVDHIKPAGSLKSYSDLAGFVERLFCEEDNLQILCKPCHQEKTNQEREDGKRKQKEADK